MIAATGAGAGWETGGGVLLACLPGAVDSNSDSAALFDHISASR